MQRKIKMGLRCENNEENLENMVEKCDVSVINGDWPKSFSFLISKCPSLSFFIAFEGPTAAIYLCDTKMTRLLTLELQPASHHPIIITHWFNYDHFQHSSITAFPKFYYSNQSKTEFQNKLQGCAKWRTFTRSAAPATPTLLSLCPRMSYIIQ